MASTPPSSIVHHSFITTTTGLKRQTPAMRLFEKAKRFGIWNPSDIDFSQDIADWRRLSPLEQKVLLHLTSLFQAGEEAVTADILPLLLTVANEGRLEEEMYLTTFLFEEAKHTDFFRRFLDEVVGVQIDLSHFHTPSYRAIVYEALPTAMRRLLVDPSPAAQVRASVTYNMIVEGVLAETGYHAYLMALERNDLMPGTCRGVRLLKQDESRHIAYGIYLISRLLAEDDRLWEIAEKTMNELLEPALGVVADIFGSYETMPFGLDESEFAHYALAQFQKRLERLEHARNVSLEEIDRVTDRIIDGDSA
ncbi:MULTISPECIES: R2-like ligand-binding oxidase [Caldilinea]|jgi:ribonucleoside-diphosphate reductase beta chain|nr:MULTISPECIES: R2-like ligand-binding oxidase [Caldilinea]MBO9391507.1 R2-like ligand-binding oxidase [Caldilinea sp.]GIV75208.1 MAG: ribonucleotide-diphosphate reductase [Caldilinea sp.]